MPDLGDVHLVVRLADNVTKSSSWASSAVNVIAGGLTAIVGGFSGAYLSEHFANRRRAADKLSWQKSSAFAFQLQLMSIYSDLAQYRECLGQSRLAFRANLPNRLFRAQYHQAYAGIQSEVHFQIDELRALSEYGSTKLLNFIADIDRRFNAIVAAINQYRSLWLEVGSLLEGPVEGKFIQLSLTQQDVNKLGPKFATLSRMLDDLDPLVEELVNDAYFAQVGLFHARVKALGLAGTFEAIAPNGKVVTIHPDPKAEPPEPKPLSEK
ncbi:hypothetical protein [uncultured Brevundimonas sp.]|uniref:hypothetical protein n=1 Tax=uncultured Brevundimonas sp. TaxID=213418 RepID=UPI00262976A2|nr:hypothetical protein [uncultured Brevundimonas sp.]